MRIGTKGCQVCVLPQEHTAQSKSIWNTKLNPALKAFNVSEVTGHSLP